MSLARIKTWNPGDVLTAADLNGEIDNIIDHPISLISPTTGPINFASVAHTNLVPSALVAGSTGTLLVTASSGVGWQSIGSTALLLHYTLDVRTSGVTVANTAVESTIYSLTIPGGTFQGGQRQMVAILNATKQVAGATSSNGENYRLYIGGALVGSSSLSNTWQGFCFNGTTTGPEFVQRTLALEPGGSSSQMFVKLWGDADFSGAPFGTIILSSVDWAASQTVALTQQWSSASANNSLIVKSVSAQVF